MLFKFINKCQKEILRCAPCSSHGCDIYYHWHNFKLNFCTLWCWAYFRNAFITCFSFLLYMWVWNPYPILGFNFLWFWGLVINFWAMYCQFFSMLLKDLPGDYLKTQYFHANSKWIFLRVAQNEKCEQKTMKLPEISNSHLFFS